MAYETFTTEDAYDASDCGEPIMLNAAVRGSRRIHDSATTLDGAKARIAARSAKPHNRGEHAEVYYAGNLVLSTAEAA